MNEGNTMSFNMSELKILQNHETYRLFQIFYTYSRRTSRQLRFTTLRVEASLCCLAEAPMFLLLGWATLCRDGTFAGW